MTEMTDIAQMTWFKDFETTNDKKALVAKVSGIWLSAVRYSTVR